MARKKGSASILFIFITLVIDVLGIGLIVPIMPTLISSFTGGDLSSASQYSGWMMASYAIMQFLFSPVLGGLSDQFGRRPIILISLLGFSLNYLISALAPNLLWLFLARIFSGITGASFTTAQAYIADISKPEDRAKNFGMVGAAFGIGFIIGPAVGVRAFVKMGVSRRAVRQLLPPSNETSTRWILPRPDHAKPLTL